MNTQTNELEKLLGEIENGGSDVASSVLYTIEQKGGIGYLRGEVLHKVVKPAAEARLASLRDAHLAQVRSEFRRRMANPGA